MKPKYPHNSSNSIYLGTELVNTQHYDYYFDAQGGMPTVIARFGEGPDYYSSLMAVKSLMDMKMPVMEQLKSFTSQDESIFVLARATILSIENGLLDENLKATQNKVKSKL